MTRPFVVMLVVAAGSRAAGQPLAPQELAQAIALGQRCQAPIVRLSSSRGDFELYLESPFARVALVSAAARVMHQPLDAPGVKQAMRPGYRIWFVPTPGAPFAPAVTNVTVRFRSGEITPVGEHDERFFLGTVPSHGIIEALRARFPEFEFDRLPPDNFVVLVGTSSGTQTFTVSQRDRLMSIRVCN